MFTTFDVQPLGAASLAQVHKATLRDGRVVAVKVQHPKVKGHSFVDIKTMEVRYHRANLRFKLTEILSVCKCVLTFRSVQCDSND